MIKKYLKVCFRKLIFLVKEIKMICIVLHCIVSYPIVSNRIVSCRIVSYRIVSYRIVSYRIVSYRIVSYCIVITDWLSANKLSLNVNKTKCMVFHSDKKKILYPKLFIDAIEIERAEYFNLQLNHTLTWNKQLSCVSQKIKKITDLLHKL